MQAHAVHTDPKAAIWEGPGMLWYEGEDPEGFAALVREQFDYDPSTHPRWGDEYIEDDGESWISYGFEPADPELRQTIHDLDHVGC